MVIKRHLWGRSVCDTAQSVSHCGPDNLCPNAAPDFHYFYFWCRISSATTAILSPSPPTLVPWSWQLSSRCQPLIHLVVFQSQLWNFRFYFYLTIKISAVFGSLRTLCGLDRSVNQDGWPSRGARWVGTNKQVRVMRNTTLFVLLVASFSRAFQFPFDVNSLHWLTRPQTPLSDPVPPRSPRVAIIGAGAGGSSAAFWIAKAKERNNLDVLIDIYERNDYIGGRKSLNLSYGTLALGLTFSKEVPQYTRITTQHMSPWNSVHPSLYA